jgi:hypothetical protein
MMEHLRTKISSALYQDSIELLVLDGTERPWMVLTLIDVVRGIVPALPIILYADNDIEVHKEAQRLAVDVVLQTPPSKEELSLTALELAPILSEVEDQIFQ